MSLAVLVLAVAVALGAFARRSDLVAWWRAKSERDWVLDLSGLAVQGVLVPVLQVGLVAGLWGWAFPGFAGVVAAPDWLGFVLAFVAVDYLYYWNHRWLHLPGMWPVHRAHHTVTQFDMLGTSRNTLWASALIVYLWVHPLLLHLLAADRGYLLGVALTSALDLWRHGAVGPRPGGPVYALLSPWMILPLDHAWHHAAGPDRGNYGANLKVWDRLHGTWFASQEWPERLGLPPGPSLAGELFWPWRGAGEAALRVPGAAS